MYEGFCDGAGSGMKGREELNHIHIIWSSALDYTRFPDRRTCDE